MDGVVGVLEVVIVVVDSIPGDLEDHAVSLRPSSGSWARDGGRVDELGEGGLRWHLKSGWRESAQELAWISVVGEFVTSNEDFLSTTNGTHVWIDVSHDWLLVVGEGVAGVAPVEAVETDLEGELASSVSARRRLADEPDRGVEVRTDNLVSESAVWHDAILWGVAEPGTEDLDKGTSLGESSAWVHLQHVRRPV